MASPRWRRASAATIAGSTRVSNPGCYPTGFIGLVRPLVTAGIVPADWPVTVNAVSGYSGGGKAMIAEFEAAGADGVPRLWPDAEAQARAGDDAAHGAGRAPVLFAPAVGRYAQGMLVEVPLQLCGPAGSRRRSRRARRRWPRPMPGARFVEVRRAGGRPRP